jgi:hypothetical protein
MAAPVRIPISNELTGDLYTVPILAGSGAVTANVLLDTGSSMLAVDGAVYKPSADTNATTTQLLQTASFGFGSYMAAVVRTNVALGETAGANVTLRAANLAVTYQLVQGTFDSADGIFGLAYSTLDTAYQMPADTSKNRYTADQLSLGRAADLDPYFDQLTAAGLVNGRFGFAVRRSIMSQADPGPATDALNGGLFVLGGGADCTDLYTGAMAQVAVVHEQYYNTNLLAVQVGDQSTNVPPAAPGSRVASNSIIDSGAGMLKLDQGLYDRVLGMFRALNPDFAGVLQRYSPSAGSGGDQTQLDLTSWPPLRFVFQGSDGGRASVTVAPQDYFQFDSGQKGTATTALAGDNGSLAGQSNLGLPIFGGHFVVFDRTASSGHGWIGFAARA